MGGDIVNGFDDNTTLNSLLFYTCPEHMVVFTFMLESGIMNVI